MDATKRRNGKLLRQIAKLDRTWRRAGKQEGRLENQLAFELGNAARAGMSSKSRKIQHRNTVQI